MRSGSVTIQEVKDAITVLMAEKGTYNASSIRGKLGKGSFATIQKHIVAIQAETGTVRTVRTFNAPATVPAVAVASPAPADADTPQDGSAAVALSAEIVTAIDEATGNLGKLLTSLAEHFQAQARAEIDKNTAALEALLTEEKENSAAILAESSAFQERLESLESKAEADALTIARQAGELESVRASSARDADTLKAALTDLATAQNMAAKAGELENELKSATARVAELEKALAVSTAERENLENALLEKKNLLETRDLEILSLRESLDKLTAGQLEAVKDARESTAKIFKELTDAHKAEVKEVVAADRQLSLLEVVKTVQDALKAPDSANQEKPKRRGGRRKKADAVESEQVESASVEGVEG